ncbi:MAG: SusD/RagB family nutrient-binding outer membrane lipoprotein [Bacteroidota bacterium]
MKKSLIYIGLASVLFMAGCTKDFDEINTDPTQSSPATFDPNFFLSNSQWTYVDGIMGYNGAILFQSGWTQIFSSTSSGGANYYSNADKYAPSSNTTDYQGRAWERGFRSAGLANEIIKNLSEKPELVNLKSAATIMKVLALHYVTDIYGDIPYSEALKGSDGISLPKYDKQEDVYKAMLSDLEGAITQFDASKAKPTSDIFNYKGDIAQWKKFGYSLMLRIAMRLTKADAALAKTWTEKAAAGGTFAGVSDNAFVLPDNGNGYTNQNARSLITVEDYYSVRWSKVLIDYLKANNDPRLGLIAEVPMAGIANNQNATLAGDNTPANQLGQPSGWDLNGGATDITKSPGYPGGTGTGADLSPIGKYSRPRTSVYTAFNTPVFVITYAETELLLAEAAARGWSVGATAAQHYKNGVSAALQTLGTLSPNATISTAAADAYATAHPLDVSSLASSLKMINEQYWATTASYMNFTEAWNNWKRSGFPVLTPVNYAGNFSGGVIPRRQPYPSGESTNNTENYKTAIAGLTGGDTWSARVWWDK